jgi:hypothetical protein
MTPATMVSAASALPGVIRVPKAGQPVRTANWIEGPRSAASRAKRAMVIARIETARAPQDAAAASSPVIRARTPRGTTAQPRTAIMPGEKNSPSATKS